MGAMEITVTLDSVDPEKLAPFWADALGYSVAGSVDNYVLLRSVDGDGPKFLIQRVSEAKAGKNRMHIDVAVADVDATVARLTGLGATRLEGDAFYENDCRWIVMADPEGNEFCVCSNEDG
jgi:predicted enzyme related to lactoylglutathione lyase